MDKLDEKRLDNRKIQAQKMTQLAQLYEDSLEPKVVLLYRRMEEMIARSGMPLTQINLVLDMLRYSCVEQAFNKYVTKGAEKLKVLKPKEEKKSG